MGTLHYIPAPGKLAALMAAAAVMAGCGGNSTNVSSRSPSPAAKGSSTSQPEPTFGATASPQPSSHPLAGAYGVLISPQRIDGKFTLSLVGLDGKVAASVDGAGTGRPTCAGVATALVPSPVSTSDTRAYFIEGDGTVRFLAPDGTTGKATTVPAISPARVSMIAVSPDDRRIAVVVATFTATGASTRLYVEDLSGGGHHVDLFTQSGTTTLWPIGWRGTTSLVLGKINACVQAGGPLCCVPIELHVVDPATATRRFTMGGSACHLAGDPTPAGVVCLDTATFTSASLVDWTAITRRSVATTGPELAYLSPDGAHIALVDNSGTTIPETHKSMNGLFTCGWIDDTHVLSGGDGQLQPRIANVIDGTTIPVPAQGICAGRLPGGL